MKHLKKDFRTKFQNWPFQFQKSQSGKDTLLVFLPPSRHDTLNDLDPHHVFNENYEKVKSELKGCYEEIIPYCQYSKENEPEHAPKENPVQVAANRYNFTAVKFFCLNNFLVCPIWLPLFLNCL